MAGHATEQSDKPYDVHHRRGALDVRGICNARLGKPRRCVLEWCPVVLAAASLHCGLFYDPVPEPAPSDPALDPSGLEFEVLKTAPGLHPHRAPAPSAEAQDDPLRALRGARRRGRGQGQGEVVEG
ncbi:hypothetical protein LY78DRAFT_676116 [Colletotrichum sublineola]|uniref:Uncharacterized protein n=1 Tax=Colletotrichum sublineola TaxID=1173701 RepID=A0A066WYE9_COLSU|nr:hypothetical protein LY78DRAFT_676116 [Colletotrichum sublineola]KDN61682.1 hypothetical protein CSUB01_05559 [Colletotrichum sublineola]